MCQSATVNRMLRPEMLLHACQRHHAKCRLTAVKGGSMYIQFAHIATMSGFTI